MPEIKVDLSRQSIELLQQLERWGIYGFDVSDIAGRIIDHKLTELAEKGHLKLVKKDNATNAKESPVETARAEAVELHPELRGSRKAAGGNGAQVQRQNS